MKRGIIAIGFVLFFTCLSYSQIIFQKTWNNINIRQVDQVYNCSAINSGNEIYEGKVIITISNAAAGLEVSSESNEFIFQPGNSIFLSQLRWNNKIESQNMSFLESVINTGRFGRGDYAICYSFKVTRLNQEIHKACFEQKINISDELRLVSPIDRAVLHDKKPSLFWVYRSEFSLSSSIYQLKIVELKKGDTKREAISSNSPVVFIDNLRQNNYSITNDYYFEDEIEYVWQVCVLNNGNIIRESDIWSFSLDSKTKKKSVREEVSNTYLMARSKPDGARFMVADSLRIAYNNRNYDSKLKYKIYDFATNEEIPESKNLPVIRMEGGLNRLTLPVRDYRSLKLKTLYLLELINSGGTFQYIKFYLLEE
mgnify:CR=1 FL=1